MLDGDRESSGDKRSEHGTHAIPDEVPSQILPPESIMDNFMRNFASSMAQHFQFHGAKSSRSQRSSRSFRRATLVEQFQELNPPTYHGNEGPEMAEQWIERLEKMFHVLDYSDADQIILAEFNLYGEADRWWNDTKRAFGDVSGVTWGDFKRMFLDKYFPFTVRESKAREFELLLHGNMTVDEYQRRFVKLSKYATCLVPDPIEMASRFRRGLSSQIRIYLAPLMLEDFDDIYCRAQMIERTLKEIGENHLTQDVTSSSRCEKRGSQGFQGPSKKGTTSSSASRRSSSGHCDGSRGAPRCSRCGTYHWGDMCVEGTPLCFRCKQPGHLRRNCPLEGQQISTEQSHFRSCPPRRGPFRPGALSRARGRGPPQRPPAQG